MANELVIHYPTGATLYALLFDATGQVWNGATFGAPSSASWTDYDITMTEAVTATGIYRASMPAVAAGVYGWVVRKQAGVNPAVTDIAVGSGEIRWTGTAEETVPAAVNVTTWKGSVPDSLFDGKVAVDIKLWLSAGVDEVLPSVEMRTISPEAASEIATAAATAILVTPANKLATGAGGEASANVTMVKGAAINDLVDGNVVVKLAAAQGAVEFGQVKITADVPNQGALHVVNSNADGQGVLYTGGEYGQVSQGGRAGVLGVDEPGIRTAIGLSTANLDTQLAALPTDQDVRDAMKLAPSAGAPAAGSVDKHLDDLSAVGDPWSTALPGAYGAGTAGALLSGIDGNVDLLLAADTSTSDATAAGAISRRRGNSWAIPLTIGAITGYTSLWFTVKSSHDDADTSALVQVKLNSPSALDGLLYVNGTTASSAALGSITVSDATTGAIVINLDETITDDLAPGTYYYDVQTLISGNVATPDSGVFTVTADVTRSVA